MLSFIYHKLLTLFIILSYDIASESLRCITSVINTFLLINLVQVNNLVPMRNCPACVCVCVCVCLGGGVQDSNQPIWTGNIVTNVSFCYRCLFTVFFFSPQIFILSWIWTMEEVLQMEETKCLFNLLFYHRPISTR